ncbi:broad-complex core protein isoforms 1/2/3/4/5 isoform X2 [Penaeus vannamei]|uniref:Broad-complex protein isoform 4 n=1 Tax=Penaeus vannamei TaxID=6689 RepID=A0A3R7QQ66_PENVA|nr:broad-complex core protein isoforms 1/2/3/4/5-like isoform X2 [Penaeus vannamei]ROT74427.1 Broad-complex protein isoform 4 [Penaeus vannamei]
MEAEVLALKWNNHQSIFYHIISGLRTKGSYTDVTLACEGKFYPVHKLVLSTCSEYFSDIFDRTPCKNPVVVLKDIQCRDLEFLLDYMYIGEVNVRQNELSSLIKAAECLRVKGLAVPDEEPKHAAAATTNTTTPNNNNSGFSGTRQRPVEQQPQQQQLGERSSSPPAKRRKGDERRSSNPPPEVEPSTVVPHVDRPLEDKPSDEPCLPQPPQESEVAAGEAEGEAMEPPPLPHIKIEQDLEYQDNYDIPLNSNPSSFDGEPYAPESEDGVRTKVEGKDNGNVMDDDLGANFSDMLQSTLTSEENMEHHSGIHPHVNLESWDGVSGARALPGHNLSAATVSHTPLAHHQQQKYPATGDLLCPICGRASSRRDNLERHIRSHLGDKPFKCPFCSFRSQLKWNMKSHIERRHPQSCQPPPPQ